MGNSDPLGSWISLISGIGVEEIFDLFSSSIENLSAREYWKPRDLGFGNCWDIISIGARGDFGNRFVPK